MILYCMCQQNNDKPDGQVYLAPNRYCSDVPLHREGIHVDFPPLALRKPMKCIKTGAVQVILDPEQDKPNHWSTKEGRPDKYSRHFPNVDVFECPSCRARAAVEVRRPHGD